MTRTLLEDREIVSYLLSSGLVAPQSIVAGDLRVVDMSRRNRNYKVLSEQAPSYLVKQGVGEEGAATIANEAYVYELVGRRAPDTLSRHLPRLHRYDADSRMLVVEFLHDAENLRDHHLRTGRFAVGVATDLGLALAELHRLPVPEQDAPPAITRKPAWILSLNEPEFDFVCDISGANLQLVRIIQQFEAFGDLLKALREDWRAVALIHGDVKWDNCLLLAKDTPRPRLRIVDWELARLGDPSWDVGSVFNDYLIFWLLSIPITGETPPDRVIELARYPLERMQPAMRAFWRSYSTAMSFGPSEEETQLVRAVGFAAARIVQTAFEQMQFAGQLSGNAVCFLQLALNMLQRRHEAMAQLLGIPLRWAAP